MRFPVTCRCEPDFGEDFESWEAQEEFLKSEDYKGLVEYCKREVTRHSENLHAWEHLGEAFVLSGQYREAIEAMGEVHRRFPDLESVQHIILDSLFAMGKTENDYTWVREPCVLRIGRAVLDDCHEYLRPKRRPRDVAELSFELMMNGYLTFSDEELLCALSADDRFFIERGVLPGFERIRVRRKREDGTTAIQK